MSNEPNMDGWTIDDLVGEFRRVSCDAAGHVTVDVVPYTTPHGQDLSRRWQEDVQRTIATYAPALGDEEDDEDVHRRTRLFTVMVEGEPRAVWLEGHYQYDGSNYLHLLERYPNGVTKEHHLWTCTPCGPRHTILETSVFYLCHEWGRYSDMSIITALVTALKEEGWFERDTTCDPAWWADKDDDPCAYRLSAKTRALIEEKKIGRMLDPSHVYCQECLDLLDATTETGDSLEQDGTGPHPGVLAGFVEGTRTCAVCGMSVYPPPAEGTVAGSQSTAPLT